MFARMYFNNGTINYIPDRVIKTVVVYEYHMMVTWETELWLYISYLTNTNTDENLIGYGSRGF